MPTKKLLFVTYGGGHATMMAAIIEHIHQHSNDNINCVTLALTMARPLLEKRGIQTLGFNDFLQPEDEQARHYGEILAKTSHSAHTGISYKESVAYLGLSYSDLVEQHGKKEAANLFAARGRMAFLPLRTMRRIIDTINPDVVITTNSPRAEEAARRAAAQCHIPTVALTDLMGKDLLPLEADHICVASRSAMSYYRSNPIVKAKHFHLTGNPAMDKSTHYRGPIAREWRQTHFPAQIIDSPWVLAAEQDDYMHVSGSWRKWDEKEIRANLNRVYDACRTNNAIMLVRPRPSLSPTLYQQWVSSKPPYTAYMADTYDLHPLLKACNLLVANTSTIMLDMLHMQRPVLLIHYPDDITQLPLDELGIAFTATIDDPQELALEMGRAISETQEQMRHLNALNEEFPPLPCAPVIARIIEDVACWRK